MPKFRKKRRVKIPKEPIELAIESFAHDCRGIAHHADKTVFVHGALPGERVQAQYTGRSRKFDEAKTLEVFEASADRVTPVCQHYAICGGCSLQHLDAEKQIETKQQILLEQLNHLGNCQPQRILAPLRGPTLGYRRKARLGVKDLLHSKDRVVVGFRERANSFLAVLDECLVIDEAVGKRLTHLGDLIAQLSIPDQIAQIEMAIGDTSKTLVFRNLQPLTEADCQRLAEFGQQHQLQIGIQSAGPESVQILWPENPEWRFSHPEFEIDIDFQPLDFFQVNQVINRQMVKQAIELLEVSAEHRVLDLFCGLGNFSLPLARMANEVVGVEGDERMTQRAGENAQANGLHNTRFFAANLMGRPEKEPWAEEAFQRVLLDPPRSGAKEIMPVLKKMAPERIVYVSCNPSTLARDADYLVNHYGYRLEAAGVMDMFPHTGHVESMALFVKA